MSIGTFRFYHFFTAFVIIVYCCAAPSAFAIGSGTIKATVLDKTTSDPLIGANILVLNTSLGGAANIDGVVTIYGVPTGEQNLKITYVGYKELIVPVTVADGGILEVQFQLQPQAIEGEEVVVTAQARGQNDAINQQLASKTISNIVAADRIKELPDASAAESIGRLPGISIDRYNGEATGVAIRGLSPKYNTVTVNGVMLPATSTQDRSVDLSLISSNLLDGIEVKKANTADMDADALGGTIDLRLKEAPEGFKVSGGIQGGYNELQNYYGNYNANFSVSNRFLDNSLGVIIGLNVDRNNRTADKLNVAYLSEASNLTLDNVKVNQLTTRREEAFKNRYGGNIILDYRLPNGKVSGSAFFSKAKTDGVYRQDQMDFKENKHYYSLQQNVSTTSVYTGSIGIAQDFDWVKYDLGVAVTGSQNDEPNDNQWQFNQEAAAFRTPQPTAHMALKDVYNQITPDDSATAIQQVYLYTRRLNENTKSTQLNVQVPFNIADNISGYVKTGGKIRWINRNYDQEQVGRGGMAYGGLWNSVASRLTRGLASKYPEDYNFIYDSTIIAAFNIWPLPRFSRGYTPPSNFLGGDFKLGMSPDLRLMQEFTDIYKTLGSGLWQRISIGSMGSDYDGFERYGAGYIMAEINIGPDITFTPGVRYDADYTIYSGETFRAVNSSQIEQPPLDFRRNLNKRQNHFWLPSVHLKIHPVEWLRIHLAGTETVTRPDFLMYAPITSMDTYGNTVIAANGALRDSRSKNLDASISIYEKYAGLITVSGFYKKIDDLILYAGIPNVTRNIYLGLDANLNAPLNWFYDLALNPSGVTPKINTWINNPTAAQYRGIELDWQTNFWYLPSVFKGLVFNLNWTYIVSQVDLQQWFTDQRRIWDPINDGYIIIYSSRKETRRSRMPGQPAHIFNMTFGYDYKGFSIRTSYLYQSDKFTNGGETAVTDAFTGEYKRWDLAVQQKFTEYIQIYANFNNLTNTHDVSLLGYREDNPQSYEYYGQTIDVGLRFNF